MNAFLAASTRAMLANQQPSGAYVASPDFDQYHYCWLRDGSFIAHALDRLGEFDSADRFHSWCASSIDRIAPVMEAATATAMRSECIDPAKMPPARFSLDGRVVEDEWPNFQIDGYGTWLWSLELHLARAGRALPAEYEPAVRRTARYLAAIGTQPCFDVWEEHGDAVHTATLGSVFAGLTAASSLLALPALAERAEEIRAGILASAERRGRFTKSNVDPDVDGSLLWLSRPFGVIDAASPLFEATVAAIASTLDLEGGTRRYAADTYYGGGAWPVLTASLGWHYSAVGELDEANARLRWISDRFDSDNRLAEQFAGSRRDPPWYAEWVERWGPPAEDLLWSHAMFVVLSDELGLVSDHPASESPAVLR
jgi:isomaltose glucohydrolase